MGCQQEWKQGSIWNLQITEISDAHGIKKILPKAQG